MAAQLTVMFAAAEDDTAGTYNGYSYERLLDYAIIYEYSGEAKGEIVLPEYVDGLKVLGVYGDLFEGCTELESAVFPDSYYNITGNVFGGCTSLKKVHLPESLEVMQCSFMDCTSLMELKIPESVTELLGYGYENSGFYNNPDNWDNGSFYYDGCLMMANSESTGEFHVKPGTRLIAKYAFAGNDNLTDVIFPDGLETICPAAFDSCSNLKEPVIPESVTYIGNGAFEDAGFTDGTVDCDVIPSNYTATDKMVEEWFATPPSPGMPTMKDRFLNYFDEETVCNYIEDVKKELNGKFISVNTRSVYINVIK